MQIDGSGRITSFCEKIEESGQPLVNAGIYCLNRDIFNHLPEGSKFSLETDLFPGLAGKQFFGYHCDKQFIDIGTPQRYETLKEELKKGKNIGN